jgi:hypothetical protein
MPRITFDGDAARVDDDATAAGLQLDFGSVDLDLAITDIHLRAGDPYVPFTIDLDVRIPLQVNRSKFQSQKAGRCSCVCSLSRSAHANAKTADLGRRPHASADLARKSA